MKNTENSCKTYSLNKMLNPIGIIAIVCIVAGITMILIGLFSPNEIEPNIAIKDSTTYVEIEPNPQEVQEWPEPSRLMQDHVSCLRACNELKRIGTRRTCIKGCITLSKERCGI